MKMLNYLKGKMVSKRPKEDSQSLKVLFTPDAPMPEPKPTIFDIPDRIFTFPFGTANTSRYQSGNGCLNLSIDPSYIFEDMIIKIGKHVSKINEISISYNINNNNKIKYLNYLSAGYANFKISRNIYPITYGVDDSEQISETLNDVWFDSYIPNFITKPLYEEELEDFIKDVLFPYIKNSIVENFRQEILTYNRKIIEKDFFKKINEVTIKDAFAFVSDLIEGCSIIDANVWSESVQNKRGYIFKIPMLNNNNLTYQLNDTMINLLFELSEGINKIKIEYKELDSYINFDNNFINIHLYPENTGLNMRSTERSHAIGHLPGYMYAPVQRVRYEF